MPPCWVVHQLLLVIVLKGTMTEGYDGHRSESDSENDFYMEFTSSAVLAFVPASSCHLQLSGDHGTFSPPEFYMNININLWCNWTVLAAPGKHIVIYITGFQTTESCRDNLDEIIFEGISSSIENSIVYACWNKHTHVFATEASAVNIVLLWRSFSNNGGKKYFAGRYYIFDDPVLGANMESGNYSLASKQNVSTIDVVEGSHPDKGLKEKSNLYSVFPKSSSSKSVKSSTDHSPEVHYTQGPATMVETYSPTLTVDHLPTPTTREDGMLPVTPTLAQSLSAMDYELKPQLPVLTQSMDLSVYMGHTVQPTAEDLEPSQVGKWESDEKTSHPEFVSKTPSLISTNSTELLEVAHLPITSGILETQSELMYVSTIHVGELHSITQLSLYSSPTTIHETPQLNTTHTVVSQKTYFENSNVQENQDLSRADFEPLGDLHFITSLTTDPPEPSLVHMLHTDLPEPSLLSYLSLLSKDQTSEPVSMPNISMAQAFSKTPNVSVTSSIESTETISLRLTKYIEPTVSNVSPVHHIDSMENTPLYTTDIAKFSEVPKSTVTNIIDLSEMQHFSTVYTIGQSVDLNIAESAHLQMLSIKIESHPKEPVPENPWQVVSSHPTPHPDSLTMSQLQSTTFTEARTSELPAHVLPLQVSEPPFLPSYESVLGPPFTPTKTLTNVIPVKIEVADPDDIESYTTPLVPTSSPASPVSSPEIRTSVLDFQMVHPTYWATVEQPLDPLTPQSTVVTPDPQLTLESSVASHPIPEVPTETIFEMTKTIDKMAPLTESISSKSLESYSLLTIDHKITSSLVEPTKELDWWTVKDNLEASDSTSRIPIHPISTSVSYLETTDKMELDMDLTTIEIITSGTENSTYSYQTNSDLDLQQNTNTAGQPRGGYLDEEDGPNFFGNQSDFTLDHKPGDSLFVITIEIENKDEVFHEDLVKSVRDKIAERMIYFPGGRDSLIFKEFRWINMNRVKLTFWLQLNHGGELMMNFLKTQLKVLENYPFGSSSATLKAFTIDDVNECHLWIHKCHVNAVCDNSIGSYSCSCMDGYEDRSVAASGTVCIYSKLAEIRSLSEHMEILITAIVGVAVTLLLIIVVLCVIKHKRQVKVNFRMQDPSIIKHGAHLGGDRHGTLGQPLSSQTKQRSPRHGREHPTARDTSSTLELTRITVEEASC